MTSRSANTAPESSNLIVKSTLHRPLTRVPGRDDPSPSKTYADVSTPPSSNKTMTVKLTAIVRVSYTVNRGTVVRRLLPSVGGGMVAMSFGPLLAEGWSWGDLPFCLLRVGHVAIQPYTNPASYVSQTSHICATHTSFSGYETKCDISHGLIYTFHHVTCGRKWSQQVPIFHNRVLNTTK